MQDSCLAPGSTCLCPVLAIFPVPRPLTWFVAAHPQISAQLPLPLGDPAQSAALGGLQHVCLSAVALLSGCCMWMCVVSRLRILSLSLESELCEGSLHVCFAQLCVPTLCAALAYTDAQYPFVKGRKEGTVS